MKTPQRNSLVDEIYYARDRAISALEDEAYGEVLRLLAVITELRARVLPSESRRRQLLFDLAEVLKSLQRLEDDLDLDRDIDESL